MNRIAIISPDATDEMLNSLKALDIEPITAPRTELVDDSLSGHPDLQMFIHNKKIFCHPGISSSFIKKIDTLAEVTICGSKLSPDHPGSIPYNIACTGITAFHRAKYMDDQVRSHLKLNNINIINVKQGFSKCSTLIVDENNIITADRSIHLAALMNRISSLMINSGSITLPGFNYGFIGGASGLFDDTVILTGTIDHHPDSEKIIEFIESVGKKIVILSKDKIIDLGSIFIIN